MYSIRPKRRIGARQDQGRSQATLDELLNAGIRTSATYTIGQCVKDWLDSIDRDPHTMETIAGQAKNWIYPKIGTMPPWIDNEDSSSHVRDTG